ncbi:MAG TPA: hypothetical protein VKA38_04220 [Draconibacterium sp.]|nr:hypothetical protein [Draconibacterium sp.]
MDKKQVKQILDNCSLPGDCSNAEIKETHISWIILTKQFAYKIKRPVHYSFLDFSSSEKRKFFCAEELWLNRRMEPEMYLDVLPVTKNLVIVEGEPKTEVIDYALKMKRMDNSKEMDAMLRENKVTEQHIEKLAEKIVRFHKDCKVVKNAFHTLNFHEKFADLQNHADLVSENLGEKWKEKIDNCVDKSFKYLNSIRNLSNERVISGFHRDCHGDLNARNIFLYDEPVVFDCIEFNREYRQIDVLNDIAFLCVDLDFFGRSDYSELFYKKYLDYSGWEDVPETRQLFLYYKSYRANVRAKVTLLSAKNKKPDNAEKELNDAGKYIDLMEAYMEFMHTNN